MYTQLMHFDIRQEIFGSEGLVGLKPPTLFQLAWFQIIKRPPGCPGTDQIDFADIHNITISNLP